VRRGVDISGIAPVTERAVLGTVDAVLASDLIQKVVDRVLASGVADQVAARLFAGPELERIAAAALESPGINRIADRVVESPTVERVVLRLIQSRLMDEAVVQLLESDDLWLLVDEIARSPSVTEAISHQGLGFADQVAAAVRERSQRADARLEHAARRLVRRETDDDRQLHPGP
jgi:hypothetical protein